jgi:hypothetical protein
MNFRVEYMALSDCCLLKCGYRSWSVWPPLIYVIRIAELSFPLLLQRSTTMSDCETYEQRRWQVSKLDDLPDWLHFDTILQTPQRKDSSVGNWSEVHEARPSRFVTPAYNRTNCSGTVHRSRVHPCKECESCSNVRLRERSNVRYYPTWKHSPFKEKWTRLLQCLNCSILAVRLWITTYLYRWPIWRLPSTCMLCIPLALRLGHLYPAGINSWSVDSIYNPTEKFSNRVVTGTGSCVSDQLTG